MAQPKATLSSSPQYVADVTNLGLEAYGPHSHLDTSHRTSTGTMEHINFLLTEQLSHQGALP